MLIRKTLKRGGFKPGGKYQVLITRLINGKEEVHARTAIEPGQGPSAIARSLRELGIRRNDGGMAKQDRLVAQDDWKMPRRSLPSWLLRAEHRGSPARYRCGCSSRRSLLAAAETTLYRQIVQRRALPGASWWPSRPTRTMAMACRSAVSSLPTRSGRGGDGAGRL